MKVVVPVTSLCPCSKKISDYGAHNQRSHVTVTTVTNSHLWIEELVQMVEEQGLLRALRPAQAPRRKYVTERAYDNPKFVEDMVRDVAGVMNREPRIDAYVVESENFESIHNHSAYALIERQACPVNHAATLPPGLADRRKNGPEGSVFKSWKNRLRALAAAAFAAKDL